VRGLKEMQADYPDELYHLWVDPSQEQIDIEDTPQEYSVRKADTPSGIIVFGLYPDDRWIPNPKTRELIAHLVRCLLLE
jgi:hypothetical protein